MKPWPTILALVVSAYLATGSSPGAAAGEHQAGKELPCPDPKPRFNCDKIDRTLNEPKYGSDAPLYRFFALGPEGKTTVALVADESQGAGKGVDRLYVDLNANRDITEPGERFVLDKPFKVRKARGNFVTAGLSNWGTDVLPKRKLEVPDPTFDYTVHVGYGFVQVETSTKDGSWRVPLRILDGGAFWSTSRAEAPVWRFGGDEIAMRNEDFILTPGRGGEVRVDGVGKKLQPGMKIGVDAVTPFFAGSSASVSFSHGASYVMGGHPGLRARIEFLDAEGKPLSVEMPIRNYCGGSKWGTALLTTFHPTGRANLVISLDTGSYRGTLVKRLPFVMANPRYGKAVSELPVTRALRTDHPDATVLELYQGADAAALGLGAYDAARDTYFGDGRQDRSFGGSCTNLGTGLVYGDDLRFQLHLGGEARRALIKYDLSMLGKDTTVAKALLMLHVERLNREADLTYRVIALKKRWSETLINVMGGLNPTLARSPDHPAWRYPVGKTEDWDEPLYAGEGDRHREPVATATFKDTGWAEVDLTAAVRKWVGGSWANHGVAIEMAKESISYGKYDVMITASDSPVDPSFRPRLVLVLKGKVTAVPHSVRQSGGDLAAALARAKAARKRVLCHVLSAGSLTSRRFERHVLGSVPAVRKYIDGKFVEVRLDGDRPEHRPMLKAWGVRRFPTAIVLDPAAPEGQERVAIIEPFDWDAPFGLDRSGFEFEQIYTKRLARIPAGRSRPR
jgi:hypothetical protein